MEDSNSKDKASILDLLKALLLRKRHHIEDVDDLEEEIHEIINEGQARGLITDEESHMVYGVLELKETTAASIMVPRTDVKFAKIDSTLGEVIDIIKKYGHTRIPIGGQGIDDIVGILHAKDLLRLWGEDLSKKIPKEILRPPYFVPENKKIGDLLRELRKMKTHMAIVTDEYGGTSGIVTLEDIIEEIVGEIMDEHDNEDPKIVPLGEGKYCVDARLHTDELEELFDIEFPEGDYESVGGFIIYLLGRIPKKGEKVTFKDLEIVIEEADSRRIYKVVIEKKKKETTKKDDK